MRASQTGVRNSVVLLALPALLISGIAVPQAPLRAQNATTAAAATDFTFKARRQSLRSNGARLEGDAMIDLPGQMKVEADVIAFDSSPSARFKEVRARGNVRFALNLKPSGGGAAAHIEARAAEATLDPATRTLVLTGNVSGFYQLPGGPKNSLTGSRATLKSGEQLQVDIEGGAAGVRIVVPPEAGGNAAALGTVAITAQRVSASGATGRATFTGNARAVSTDGPNKFDVSAPAFVVSRGASGVIDTLQTEGRTTVKMDLPPEPVVAGAAPMTSGVGRPTRVEVSADGATVRRSDNTLIFEGNVKGFYLLQNAGSAPSRHEFSGDRAIVKFVEEAAASATNPAGLQVDVTGKPVSVQVPQFNLGF